MHFPNPLGIARSAQRAWSYFRSGVRVEGEAFLTDEPRVWVYVEGMPDRRVPQHISVQLRFWASRGEPVTVIDIARAEVPLYGVELSDFGTFESVELQPGQKPVDSYFRLYPKENQEGRVEATSGALLELEFRPSRGSEKWARPKISVPLGLRR